LDMQRGRAAYAVAGENLLSHPRLGCHLHGITKSGQEPLFDVKLSKLFGVFGGFGLPGVLDQHVPAIHRQSQRMRQPDQRRQGSECDRSPLVGLGASIRSHRSHSPIWCGNFFLFSAAKVDASSASGAFRPHVPISSGGRIAFSKFDPKTVVSSSPDHAESIRKVTCATLRWECLAQIEADRSAQPTWRTQAAFTCPKSVFYAFTLLAMISVSHCGS
jgi:hypothetical protein